MTTSHKQPKLGGLYERIAVVERRGNTDLVEENYILLREKKDTWRLVSLTDSCGDPLLLWEIKAPSLDSEVLEYHFLWKGTQKVFSVLDKDENFFKWFDVWWRIKEDEKT